MHTLIYLPALVVCLLAAVLAVQARRLTRTAEANEAALRALQQAVRRPTEQEETS